jgi:hypothetical protein
MTTPQILTGYLWFEMGGKTAMNNYDIEFPNRTDLHDIVESGLGSKKVTEKELIANIFKDTSIVRYKKNK